MYSRKCNFFKQIFVYWRHYAISSGIPQHQPPCSGFIAYIPSVDSSLPLKQKYMPVYHSNVTVAMATNDNIKWRRKNQHQNDISSYIYARVCSKSISVPCLHISLLSDIIQSHTRREISTNLIRKHVAKQCQIPINFTIFIILPSFKT